MISFNYCLQGCTRRLSQLCLPLWFHLTIVYNDVQADCLNYVYHYDFQGLDCLLLWFQLLTRMYQQIVSIMFTTIISFIYCSQGCTSRFSQMFTTMISFNNCLQGCTSILFQLCLPLWFHLTIVYKDVQADCLNYVYHYDFI